MKKIKILAPILGLSTLVSGLMPLATSCSKSTTTDKVIPTDLLDVEGYTLKGFVEDAKISDYDTLTIPEGVKFIAKDAFNGLFNWTTNALTQTGICIKKVIFPSSIERIELGAFANLDQLEVLDFSAWDTDKILSCPIAQIESSADTKVFDKCDNIGKVIMHSDLTDETISSFQDKLIGAGLSVSWFNKDTYAHISADEVWLSQQTATGRAKFPFKVDKALQENEVLYARITKTGGTQGVDAYIDYRNMENPYLDVVDGIVTLPINMFNQWNNGEYVTFDVTFDLINTTGGSTSGAGEVVWSQTLKNFRLEYVNKASNETTQSLSLYTTEGGSTYVGSSFNIKKDQKYTFNFVIDEVESTPVVPEYITVGPIDDQSVEYQSQQYALWDDENIKVFIDDKEMKPNHGSWEPIYDTLPSTATKYCYGVKFNADPLLTSGAKVRIETTFKMNVNYALASSNVKTASTTLDFDNIEAAGYKCFGIASADIKKDSDPLFKIDLSKWTTDYGKKSESSWTGKIMIFLGVENENNINPENMQIYLNNQLLGSDKYATMFWTPESNQTTLFCIGFVNSSHASIPYNGNLEIRNIAAKNNFTLYAEVTDQWF